MVALVGASGMGKTTLMRTLAGMYTPHTGTVEMDADARIGFVCQNATDGVSPARTILSQMLESTDKHTAHTILSELGILDQANRYCAVMSGGQKMRALLAINMAMSPTVLLLDEPTANLDTQNRTFIMRWVRQYVDKTGAIAIWCTHDMDVVESIADRVLHMPSKGCIGADMPVRDFLQSLPSPMPMYPISHDDKTPVIRMQDVTLGYKNAPPVIARFNMQVNRGEIVGIFGESGCGKTTLLRGILGQIQPRDGHIYSPKHIQQIFQDAKHALNPRWSIFDSLAEPLRFKGEVDIQDHVYTIAKTVGIPPHRLHDTPEAFSGGECQRICIARAFIGRPSVVLADEMSSALDGASTREILHLVQNFQCTYGASVVFVSHDRVALEWICNRIVEL